MDATVLVTGGSGYLGSLVVARLAAAGVPLVSLDRRDPAEPVEGVHYVTGDLRETDLAGLCREHEVEAVVHLAAIVEPPKDMSEDELEAIEVGGTERIIAACLDAGGHRGDPRAHFSPAPRARPAHPAPRDDPRREDRQPDHCALHRPGRALLHRE